MFEYFNNYKIFLGISTDNKNYFNIKKYFIYTLSKFGIKF